MSTKFVARQSHAVVAYSQCLCGFVCNAANGIIIHRHCCTLGQRFTACFVHRFTPKPVVARCAEDILKARGVKPSLSPNLDVLATVEALDVKRLLFIGVGCQVQVSAVCLMPFPGAEALGVSLEITTCDMEILPTCLSSAFHGSS